MQISDRLKDRLTLPLWAGVGVFAGLFFLRTGGLVPLTLLTGLFLMFVIFYRPIIGILAIMAGVCFIPYNTRHLLFNIGSIHIPDLILYFLFFILVIRILIFQRSKLVRTPMDLPLIAFFLVGFFTLVWGKIFYSYSFFDAFREFKLIAYYLLALLVTNLTQNKKDLKILICGCLFLGIISGLPVIFKACMDPPMATETPKELYYKYFGANAGLIQFWALICLFSLLLVRKIRTLYIIAWVITFVAFILWFARHYWISMVFSHLLGFSLTLKKYKPKIIGFLSLIFVLTLFSISATLLKLQPVASYVNLITLRLDSLTALEKMGTVDIRMVENKFAIEKILDHPVFGIGFTRHYRPKIYGPDDNIQWYLHNGYLWILLKMGMLGFIPFVWFSYIFVTRAIRNWQRVQDKFLSAIVLGSMVSYLGIAVTNLATALFMENWETAVFGVSFGINEVIYRIEGIDLKPVGTNETAHN